MKKLIRKFIWLSLLCLSNIGYTQSTKPVQFQFSVLTLPSNQVLFNITARIEKNAQFIATQQDDSTLYSIIIFDSALQKHLIDSSETIANVKSFIDKDILLNDVHHILDET